MASYAICESLRLGGQRALYPNVTGGLSALADHLRRLPPNTAESELLLWCWMCVLATESHFDGHRLEHQTPSPSACEKATAALRAAVERHLDQRADSTALRQRAAQLLLDHLRGTLRPDDPQFAARAAPFLEIGWPVNADDPMTMWYWSLVSYNIGGATWSRFVPRIAEVVVKTQRVDPGIFRGSWDPRGEFGSDGGRACTFGAHALTKAVYYRSCRLRVLSGGE